MRAAAALFALCIILAVLWEAFETVILPRRVARKLRFTRYYYQATWWPWRGIAFRINDPKRRETMLSLYGPLSLVMLFVTWAVLLLVAFGILHWGLGSVLTNTDGKPVTFGTDLYMSGTALFTLGLGDVAPLSAASRAVTVAESAIGFGLVALVLSYLPTLYQAFATREVNISLLDARAGSPPTAREFLDRYAVSGDSASLNAYLAVCERWASELLESHLSYPALCYFRSQHANQSWLAGLTTVLDVCVLVEVSGTANQRWQAQLTFAMARHAVVDLTQVFHLKPIADVPDRMTPDVLEKLRQTLPLDDKAEERMRRLRQSYEPFVDALSRFLAMELAPWVPKANARDNWSTSNKDV